ETGKIDLAGERKKCDEADGRDHDAQEIDRAVARHEPAEDGAALVEGLGAAHCHQECAKISSSSQPMRSRSMRVGRKRKQVSASSDRPSRLSMRSRCRLMSWR